VLDSRGERDADHIRNVIDFQRKLELGSRAVLLSSLFPPAWLAGTVGLSVAKIVENMEIGHNVMHGQWDNRLLHFMTGNLSFQIEHHLSKTCRATATRRSRRRSKNSSSAMA
jgi:fatty acid desaturase